MGKVVQFLKNVMAAAFTPFNLLLWFAITAVVTVAAPFGTADISLGLRAAYWGGVALVTGVLGYALRSLLCELRPDDGLLARALSLSALMAVLVTPLILVVAQWTAPYRSGPVTSHFTIAISVFMITGGLEFVRSRSFAPRRAERPRLLARLPENLWGEVIRLSSNDHYVEVCTDRGCDSILIRFSDALAELDGVDGLQVHRSHWVARHAIRQSAREGGRVFLELIDGSRVPVSRGYLAAVREAGILEKIPAA
ncbi:MAG: LytTR family DNA-binding domain-containing protein [Paracoccaceae bacterium]